MAHRGLHDSALGIIENTSSAVEAAIEGNFGIEVDVQLAGDGEVMVFHDYTLDRLTDMRGALLSKPACEIQCARFKKGTDRIQTLTELLEQVDGRAPLIIEAKAQWATPGILETRLAQIVRRYTGPIAVMSFDPQSVRYMREYAPNVTRGITIENFHYGEEWNKVLNLPRRLSLRHMNELNAADPQFAAIYVKDLPNAPSRLFKKRGLPVLSWTVRTKTDRERAIRFADQIIFEGFRPD
ncbi:MAG: glycerophosphodiester phosphodiesterase family protein [Hyphomicrobiales bacterium]